MFIFRTISYKHNFNDTTSSHPFRDIRSLLYRIEEFEKYVHYRCKVFMLNVHEQNHEILQIIKFIKCYFIVNVHLNYEHENSRRVFIRVVVLSVSRNTNLHSV